MRLLIANYTSFGIGNSRKRHMASFCVTGCVCLNVFVSATRDLL